MISDEVPCKTRNRTCYNYQSNNTPGIIKSMYISDNNIEIHEPKNDRKFQYSSLNLLKKKEKFSKYVEDLNNTMYKLNN